MHVVAASPVPCRGSGGMPPKTFCGDSSRQSLLRRLRVVYECKTSHCSEVQFYICLSPKLLQNTVHHNYVRDEFPGNIRH